MAKTHIALMLLAATVVYGQRPFFAGSRPIGYPEYVKPSTPVDELANKFGEGDATTTTQRLPIEALGDRDLVDRLSKLPIDKQPFWLLNWQALEAQRKNPQTYPQRPSQFADPLLPNSNSGNSLNGIPQTPSPSNAVPSNSNSAVSNSNSGTANSNAGVLLNNRKSETISNSGINNSDELGNRNGGISGEFDYHNVDQDSDSGVNREGGISVGFGSNSTDVKSNSTTFHNPALGQRHGATSEGFNFNSHDANYSKIDKVKHDRYSF